MQARPLCAPAASLGQRVVPEEQEAKGSSGLLQLPPSDIVHFARPQPWDVQTAPVPPALGLLALLAYGGCVQHGWGVQHEEQALCSAWERSPPTIQNGAAPHHLHRGLHLASTSIVLQFLLN